MFSCLRPFNTSVKYNVNMQCMCLASAPGRIFAFTSDLVKIRKNYFSQGVLSAKNRPGVEAMYVLCPQTEAGNHQFTNDPSSLGHKSTGNVSRYTLSELGPGCLGMV